MDELAVVEGTLKGDTEALDQDARWTRVLIGKSSTFMLENFFQVESPQTTPQKCAPLVHYAFLHVYELSALRQD